MIRDYLPRERFQEREDKGKAGVCIGGRTEVIHLFKEYKK